MIIHAKNIRGLGALVLSENIISYLYGKFKLALVSNELLERLEYDNCEISVIGSKFTYFARIYELLVSYDAKGEALLVLGDIPLRVVSKQLLYFQNANLLRTQKVRDLSTLKLRVNQILFRRNVRFIDHIIVQTKHIQKELENYLAHNCLVSPNLKVSCVPMTCANRSKAQCKISGDKIRLFYPSRMYPHKNHEILFASFAGLKNKYPNIDLLLTVNEDQVLDKRITCLGEIAHSEVKRIIDQDNTVLVFPSKIETLGIPLLEALEMDIPILAADLPYAHELCGNAAIYFDPCNVNSLFLAVAKIQTNQIVRRQKSSFNLYDATAKHILSII